MTIQKLNGFYVSLVIGAKSGLLVLAVQGSSKLACNFWANYDTLAKSLKAILYNQKKCPYIDDTIELLMCIIFIFCTLLSLNRHIMNFLPVLLNKFSMQQFSPIKQLQVGQKKSTVKLSRETNKGNLI